MKPAKGSAFTLTWRNDELGAPSYGRPEGFPAEQSMESRVTEADPPRRLVIAWGQGDVTFALEPAGDKTLLTLTHRRISDRADMVMIAAGRHTHLDILTLLAREEGAPAFWPAWPELRQSYEARIGA